MPIIRTPIPTPTPTAPETAPAPASPVRVMQIHLWAPPAAAWHARLAEPGAPDQVFDSPFELARYLSSSAVAAPSPAAAAAARTTAGLR